MRDLAAQKRRMQQARQLDVIDEESLAGEQAAVLVACDRSAEIAGRHDSIPIRSGWRSASSKNRAADLTRALVSPALCQPSSCARRRLAIMETRRSQSHVRAWSAALGSRSCLNCVPAG